MLMIMVDTMKTKSGRKKLFSCFRPVVDGDDYDVVEVRKLKFKEGNAGDVVNGHGEKENLVDLSSFSDDGCKKERSRKSVSRVLKSMFYETPMSRKFGSKKSRENSFRSSSCSSSSRFSKIMNSMRRKSSFRESSDDESFIIRSNSSGSSLFSSSTIGSTSLSSSSSSSFASHSRSISERRNKSCSILDLKQVPINKNNKRDDHQAGRGCDFRSDFGFCFLFVCVLVLIIWGKVFAICCTSIGFYFAPRRPIKFNHTRVNDVYMVDYDHSDEYKKRVIGEGLLVRSRSRIL